MSEQRPAQGLSVKRASVEFHNFASLGEPERVLAVYAEKNLRRSGLIRRHREFIGPMSPFLEIGANAGHSSYMLANEFGEDGFALDLSADALRHGMILQDRWKLSRAPIRITGDAANLPFADGSLPFVMTFQTLSQFMNLESIFLEVKRVLAPGGVFFFAEEPLRRMLSVRLYSCPFYETMKPWERKLYDWGLLGYLVHDVIGAHQEESFGIPQNHSMGLHEWNRLVTRHFAAYEYEVFVPERGWGERFVKRFARWSDPHRSEWRGGRLLGGTLAGFCRKAGELATNSHGSFTAFESYLRCPDCYATLHRHSREVLRCHKCGYAASNEGGVYNLLPSAERRELYPGDREDTIDFSVPDHSHRLLEGWYEVEGVFGNRFRWIGERASVKLMRLRIGPQRLRVRGHVQENFLQQGKPATVELRANGKRLGCWTIQRTGLFMLEADVPEAEEYVIEIVCSPTWSVPADARTFSVNISMLRLVPRD